MFSYDTVPHTNVHGNPSKLTLTPRQTNLSSVSLGTKLPERPQLLNLTKWGNRRHRYSSTRNGQTAVGCRRCLHRGIDVQTEPPPNAGDVDNGLPPFHSSVSWLRRTHISTGSRRSSTKLGHAKAISSKKASSRSEKQNARRRTRRRLENLKSVRSM